MTELPRAFMPDGATLLVTAEGELRLARVADGAIVARATAAVSQSSTFAVSNDGSTVAVGAGGPDLLHVWNTGTSYAVGVCALAGETPGAVALSADGRSAAVAVGPSIEVRRPEDGTLVGTVTGNGGTVAQMVLSPTGRYVAGLFRAPVWETTATDALIVIRVSDNGAIADLSQQQLGYWAGFAFAPDEQTFYAVRSAPGGVSTRLQRVDLNGFSRGPSADRPLPDYTTLVGFSRGCPVLWNSLTGAYRSCDTCDETPIPAGYGGIGVAVSPDGAFMLVRDVDTARTASLWSLPPDQRTLRVFAPPVDDVQPSAGPLAVSTGARRVLVGAYQNASCYAGHEFSVEVRDGATGDLLDQLPPRVRSSGGDLTRIAYDSQIWCAR
jgi:hypothetical protein